MNFLQANGFFSILDFGAVGDGKTDCTAAIQAAIDTAEKTHGTVWIPAGHFLTGELHVRWGVNITGMNCSTYCRDFGSVLQMRKDGESRCLLNLTNCKGSVISDIVLQGCGGDWAKDPLVHGLYVCCGSEDSCNHDYSKGGSCLTFDHVSVSGFCGDAAHMQNAGVIVFRHCILGGGRHGIYGNIWDGWVLDCMLPGGGGAGFYADQCVASITLTGNRIEWNGLGGIVCKNAYRFSISGNTIDHTGYEAMKFEDSNTLAINGNVIWRPGKPYELALREDEYSLSAVRFRGVRGVSFTGNTIHAGLEDGDGGIWTPDYGLVLEGISFSNITGNSLWGCARKQAIVDLGGHGEQFIMKDNVISLASGQRD